MSASATKASTSIAAILRLLVTLILGLTLDQATKVIAFRKLIDWPTGYPFISGWLDFMAVENHGAVFGIGQGQRLLFITVSIGAILFIFYLFRQSNRNQWLYQIVLGMLLAGVLGNLYDRAVFGYVRDMIYVFPHRRILGREPFPWVFNVADSLLCVGVGFMLIYSFFHQPPQPAESARPADVRS
jgi:signal peptidase II